MLGVDLLTPAVFSMPLPGRILLAVLLASAGASGISSLRASIQLEQADGVPRGTPQVAASPAPDRCDPCADFERSFLEDCEDGDGVDEPFGQVDLSDAVHPSSESGIASLRANVRLASQPPLFLELRHFRC